MFHRSPKGMKRWRFRTWVTRLSLASTFACWVKYSRNPFNTGLRELVLGAPRYGARRTQGNTSHATTTPVTSAVPSTLLINKTLPWIVDWILVQTFHACWKRENDDYQTSNDRFRYMYMFKLHKVKTRMQALTCFDVWQNISFYSWGSNWQLKLSRFLIRLLISMFTLSVLLYLHVTLFFKMFII